MFSFSQVPFLCGGYSDLAYIKRTSKALVPDTPTRHFASSNKERREKREDEAFVYGKVVAVTPLFPSFGFFFQSLATVARATTSMS
jgi:hypothetical protein